MAHQPEVAAEVSVNSRGDLYVGVEARQALGVGYNDRVRVTIPRQGEPDITVMGCLNAASKFYCGIGVYHNLGGERKTTEPTETINEEAIVERASRTWDEAHGLTEKRWDGHPTLACK